MALTDDAELRALFRQEMDERVEQLIAGARAMVDGTLTDEFSSSMFREGHTVKGTSRVMGFNAISDAGLQLEALWRKIQQGELDGTPLLGKALERLAAATIPAIDADPEEGTGELSAALGHLEDVVEGRVTEPEPEPEPEPELEPDPASAGDADLNPEYVQRAQENPSDLGGLLSALDTWASAESARVNAANLYRLINAVAAIGVESDGVRDLLRRLSDKVLPDSAVRQQVDQLAEALDSMERSVAGARDQALSLASVELKQISNTYPQLVTYLSRKVGKEIRFEMVGDDLSLDRQVLERLADPLRQLLVNAIEHGIEPAQERLDAGKAPTATLSFRARVKDNRLEVVIEDDGRGVDWGIVHRTAVRRGLLPAGEEPEAESLRSLLFAPGFSTAPEESELVGDGSGLTAVTEAIESLHGSFVFETEPGGGTRVTLAVPTSRALQDAMLVRAAGQEWGIPEIAVIDRFHIDRSRVHAGPHRNEVTWKDQRIPMAPFAGAVGLEEREDVTEALVLTSPVGPVALTVPAVLGQQQVAAKELGPLIGGAPHLTGAALLGGGKVVVLVDPGRLAERARALPPVVGVRPKVLVVDDSQGARQVVAAALASNGFETYVADGTEEALVLIGRNHVDALVVDFSMPGSDGIELVEIVRREIGQMPIVMLSGVATPEDQVRARRAGVDAYFDKADFRQGALAATLQELVGARTARLEEAS